MPIKRPQLTNKEVYHIILRGVEGINIFKGNTDYYRAVFNFFEFNNKRKVRWKYRRVAPNSKYENSSRTVIDEQFPKEPLVDILAFCLMPNHIHLLLRQIEDLGITDFMRKFGAGYAGYFNKKYERQGHLFQGRFRAVHIKTNNQLRSVFVYIHTNPAILIDPNWKEGGIKKAKEVIEFIENYKWSSYMDYLGNKNFPSVTQRNMFEEIMISQKWQRFVNEWVEYKNLSGWDKSIELE